MDLSTIVSRYVEGLEWVDANTDVVNANRRTGEIYPVGLPSMFEDQIVAAVDTWWATAYPEDFEGDANAHGVDVPYPTLARATCDHVLTTDGDAVEREWALEVKKPALIGSNGKRNDFAVAKMISPYLKDRGLLHDVLRLRANPMARKQAVLGFAFNYDGDSCAIARQMHPDNLGIVAEIKKVVEQNEGALLIDPLVDFCGGILSVRGLVRGGFVQKPFTAWRHPAGGVGTVFAWEVSEAPSNKHPW